MHAYLFNARRRNIKKCVSGKLFHLALKMPVLVQFAVAFLKTLFLVFLFIYPKGGYQFVDALRTRTQFFSSGDHA